MFVWVLIIINPFLQPEATRIWDLTKENNRILINDSEEVNIDGCVITGSQICTFNIDELTKCQNARNTEQYESKIKLLKSLLSRQTKDLERERGSPICEKFKSLFDGTVEHFDDSDTDSDTDDDDENNEMEDSTDENEVGNSEEDGDDEDEDDREDDDDSMDEPGQPEEKKCIDP